MATSSGTPARADRRRVIALGGATAALGAAAVVARPLPAAADVPPGSVHPESLAADVFGPRADQIARGSRVPISVADYGAVGNGVVDDSAAIQDAINVGALFGRPVALEEGKNYVAKELTLLTGSRFLGATGAKLTLSASATTGQALLRVGTNATKVTIENLVIEGNRANVSVRASCIYANAGCNDLTIRDCRIENSPEFGIGMTGGSSRIEVDSCTVLNSAYSGIIATLYNNQPITGLSVHDCFVDGVGNGHHGIGAFANEVAGMIDCSFQGNILRNIDHDAITGYSRHNQRVVCSGNVADNSGFTPAPGGGGGHFCHFGGTDITVSSNLIRYWDGVAIFLRNEPNGGDQTPGVGFVVADNIIHETVGSLTGNGEGIQIQNYSNGTVSGNRVENVADAGISVGGNAALTRVGSAITVTGNQVLGAATHGIAAIRATNVVISGNQISTCGADGVRIDRSQQISVVGNVVDDCGGAAVTVRDGGASPCEQVSIGWNILRGTSAGVVSVDGSDRVTVGSNTFVDVPEPHIDLVGTENEVLTPGPRTKTSTSETVISNTTAAVAMSTLGVPGTLRTGDVVRLRFSGTLLSNTGANLAVTWRLKLNGTAVFWNSPIAAPTTATPRKWVHDVELVVGPAEDRINGTLHVTGGIAAPLGTASFTLAGHGTSTVDVSGGAMFVLEGQLGTASAQAQLACSAAELTVVRSSEASTS